MLARIAIAAAVLAASAQAVLLHPRGDRGYCLTAWSTGSNITIETCGQPVGSQDWSYVNGHWQTTWLNGESICAAPDNDINTPPLPAPPNVVNGALVIGRYCGSRPRESWTKGPRDNTWVFHGIRMQFGYMCLDNTGGLVQSGNLVQVWKCSDYYNPNQVWVMG